MSSVLSYRRAVIARTALAELQTRQRIDVLVKHSSSSASYEAGPVFSLWDPALPIHEEVEAGHAEHEIAEYRCERTLQPLDSSCGRLTVQKLGAGLEPQRWQLVAVREPDDSVRVVEADRILSEAVPHQGKLTSAQRKRHGFSELSSDCFLIAEMRPQSLRQLAVPREVERIHTRRQLAAPSLVVNLRLGERGRGRTSNSVR